MNIFRERWPKWFESRWSTPDCGEGWFPLITKLCEDIEEIIGVDNEHFHVQQVKEKFGGLRFYVSSSPDLGLTAPLVIDRLIHKAESDSFSICESCGETGAHRSDRSWLQTRCDSCYEKQNKV